MNRRCFIQMSYYLLVCLFLMISAASARVCFLPDSTDCGSSDVDIPDVPCKYYTCKEAGLKNEAYQTCYDERTFNKGGTLIPCKQVKCKLSKSECEAQEANANNPQCCNFDDKSGCYYMGGCPKQCDRNIFDSEKDLGEDYNCTSCKDKNGTFYNCTPKDKECSDINSNYSTSCSNSQIAKEVTGVKDSHNNQCYTCESKPTDNDPTCKEINSSYLTVVGDIDPRTFCPKGKAPVYRDGGSDGTCVTCEQTEIIITLIDKKVVAKGTAAGGNYGCNGLFSFENNSSGYLTYNSYNLGFREDTVNSYFDGMFSQYDEETYKTTLKVYGSANWDGLHMCIDGHLTDRYYDNFQYPVTIESPDNFYDDSPFSVYKTEHSDNSTTEYYIETTVNGFETREFDTSEIETIPQSLSVFIEGTEVLSKIPLEDNKISSLAGKTFQPGGNNPYVIKFNYENGNGGSALFFKLCPKTNETCISSLEIENAEKDSSGDCYLLQNGNTYNVKYKVDNSRDANCVNLDQVGLVFGKQPEAGFDDDEIVEGFDIPAEKTFFEGLDINANYGDSIDFFVAEKKFSDATLCCNLGLQERVVVATSTGYADSLQVVYNVSPVYKGKDQQNGQWYVGYMGPKEKCTRLSSSSDSQLSYYLGYCYDEQDDDETDYYEVCHKRYISDLWGLNDPGCQDNTMIAQRTFFDRRVCGNRIKRWFDSHPHNNANIYCKRLFGEEPEFITEDAQADGSGLYWGLNSCWYEYQGNKVEPKNSQISANVPWGVTNTDYIGVLDTCGTYEATGIGTSTLPLTLQKSEVE